MEARKYIDHSHSFHRFTGAYNHLVPIVACSLVPVAAH